MKIIAQHLKFLTVRPATEADQAFIKQLYASTRDDLRLFPGSPALIASLIDMQETLQAGGYRSQFPDAQHGLLEHGNSPVGRVIVNVGGAEVRLVHIALLPAAQRRGFGRAVVLALQHGARARNLPLALRVDKDNINAKRLYLALGFQVCASDDIADQMLWSGDLQGNLHVTCQPDPQA